MDIGVPELLIVLVAVLLLFGGKKLPELARSLGKAQNEFKKGLTDGESDGKVDPKTTAAKAVEGGERRGGLRRPRGAHRSRHLHERRHRHPLIDQRPAPAHRAVLGAGKMAR